MIKLVLKEMRVPHYIKNLLVFCALACSGQFFDLLKLRPVIFMFVAFCLISSVVYIVNDIRDVEKDKNHPTKYQRPIASGKLPLKLAVFISASLFLIGSVCAMLCGKISAIIILILYLLLNIAYSSGLKNVPIVDVIILVSGFIFRLICGALVAEIDVSNWLYLTVFSLSFYLSLGKRRGELKYNASNTRDVLKKYSDNFLNKNMNIFLTLTVVFYSLWSVDPMTIKNHATSKNILIWTIPIVCLIVLRYSYDVDGNGISDGDPVEVLIHDKVLIILCLVYIIGMFLLLNLCRGIVSGGMT